MTDVAQSLTGEAREKEPATTRSPWQRKRPLACHSRSDNPSAALFSEKSRDTVSSGGWCVIALSAAGSLATSSSTPAGTSQQRADNPSAALFSGSPATPSAENTDDKEEESLCILHLQLAHLRSRTSLCSTADIHARNLGTRWQFSSAPLGRSPTQGRSGPPRGGTVTRNRAAVNTRTRRSQVASNNDDHPLVEDSNWTDSSVGTREPNTREPKSTRPQPDLQQRSLARHSNSWRPQRRPGRRKSRNTRQRRPDQ